MCNGCQSGHFIPHEAVLRVSITCMGCAIGKVRDEPYLGVSSIDSLVILAIFGTLASLMIVSHVSNQGFDMICSTYHPGANAMS